MLEKSRTIKADLLIIGAGIIGLALAKVLRDFYPHKEIIIIEKEPYLGAHSSGRNSGVLHAGFYYTPDSLKAKLTKQGNQELKEFCELKGLKINKCGKVIVAKNEDELEGLFELKKRGDLNEIKLFLITEKELKDLEPNAKTYKFALFSPNTITVDPLEVLNSLASELKEKEVKIFLNTQYEKRLEDDIVTIVAGGKIFKAEKIINCAGLYADKIAKEFGFSKDYELVPFKGLYLRYKGEDRFIKKNIYPVPNLHFPFLGVHFTIQADHKIKVGPTAIPAFWRENYNRFERFNFKELLEILKWNFLMFIKQANFRKLALEEIKKYSKIYLLEQAKMLVNSIPSFKLFEYSTPGIRAQLIDKKNLKLVQDFVVQGDEYSVHILNAVSPAFTASFPFARYIVDNYIKPKAQQLIK